MSKELVVQLIQDQTGLNAFIASATQQNWISLDTEFVREKTYYPLPGLIQAATASEIVCIDPIAISDLTPLYQLLSNPDITKIFHAAGQDLELLLHISGSSTTPVFDTQIAAELLGEGNQIGYAALVQQKMAVELPKSQTRTNWRARPLSSDQLSYAADDVRYLRAIYESQTEALIQTNRLDWLQEDCETLVAKQMIEQSSDQLLLRIKGHHELAGIERAIARELAIWREAVAKKRDLPRRWVVADEVLIRLAKSQQKTLKTISKINNLSPKLISHQGKYILESMQRGEAVPEIDWPIATKSVRPPPEITAKLKYIRKELTKIADRENLNPPLFASRKDLEALIDGNSNIPLMQGWRYKVAGQEIEKLL